MAAAAADEARRLFQAKEAFERSCAMAEGSTMKDWKENTKHRQAAALRSREAKLVDLKAAAEKLQAQRAAPCYRASFYLPFRRHDVWTELAKYEDPLDYPSGEWLSLQRAGAIGALSSGSLRSVAPGLVRRLERRFAFSDDAITLELDTITPPSLMRWRILARSSGGGGLATLMPALVGEDYDGRLARPGIDVVLENAPYGTTITLHVGTHGRFQLPQHCTCAVPLLAAALGCSESARLGRLWLERMTSRGYKTLGPKGGTSTSPSSSPQRQRTSGFVTPLSSPPMTPKGAMVVSGHSPATSASRSMALMLSGGSGVGASSPSTRDGSCSVASHDVDTRFFSTHGSPPREPSLPAGSTTRPFLAVGASQETKSVDIDRGFWGPLT